jgi:hypothetical protein
MDSDKQSLGERLQQEIHISEMSAKRISDLAKEMKPPAVQEAVLAQRHAEDENNRLKRAYNMLSDEEK